jgi:hypothetical protein
MGCKCCITFNSRVAVGDADISQRLISVSVDTTHDVMFEPSSDQECVPDGNWAYFFGPSKGNIQLSGYPFTVPEDMTLGFTCPVDISVQIPWKYVYDCRQCEPCIDPLTGNVAGTKRGRWVGIPMKKRQITITGDISGASSIFQPGGCAIPASKFNFQANSVIVPQATVQYAQLAYNGGPIPFNTQDIKPFSIQVSACDFSLTNVVAYLTGFTFNFTPPKPAQVNYTFDMMVNLCPPC